MPSFSTGWWEGSPSAVWALPRQQAFKLTALNLKVPFEATNTAKGLNCGITTYLMIWKNASLVRPCSQCFHVSSCSRASLKWNVISSSNHPWDSYPAITYNFKIQPLGHILVWETEGRIALSPYFFTRSASVSRLGFLLPLPCRQTESPMSAYSQSREWDSLQSSVLWNVHSGSQERHSCITPSICVIKWWHRESIPVVQPKPETLITLLSMSFGSVCIVSGNYGQ